MSDKKTPNFGGLTDAEAKGEGREYPLFKVVSVPFDYTASYVGGARKGPAAILAASANMELYDCELGTEPYRVGIETLPPLQTPPDGPEAAKQMSEAVKETVSEIANAGSVPVMLGGEHSVSTGAVGALAAIHPDLTILQLDAHADMRDSYNNDKYSHATAGRRFLERCPLTQAGVRSLSAGEAEFLRGARPNNENPIKTFYAVDIVSGRVGATEIARTLSKKVYISIDLDVFDPSIMPSTGTPEPGGLSWYEVSAIIAEVAQTADIVGFDVVELAPIEGLHAPDFTAARLVYRIMGHIIKTRT